VAVPYETLDDIVQNLIFQVEDFVLLLNLVVALEAYRATYSAVLAATMNDDDRHNQLQKLTGCTSALDVDINCYPRGLVTTLCFDSSGNPIP
jgi:hypothetical protein